MFRIASSLGTASRGIASLWLQRDSVKYRQVIEEKEEVKKEIKLEQHKLNLKKNELEILVVDNKQRQIVIEEAPLAKDEIDFPLVVRPDSQDNEIQLLKAKLKLMEENNAKLEEEKLKKDAFFQQQQIESNATIASLRNLLVSKDEEIAGLKVDARKVRKKIQTCAEELDASKNQLLYKHLALDGIIKSNIKLQEQFESFRRQPVVVQQKELREDVTLIEKISNGGLSVNLLDAGVIDQQKKQVTGRQQRRRRNRKSKKNNKS